jgi:hypothetical protein
MSSAPGIVTIAISIAQAGYFDFYQKPFTMNTDTAADRLNGSIWGSVPSVMRAQM